MSDGSRSVEHELQDYLDGRLPAEGRAAFEDRLARSPELRRELESALEIREALGTGDEVLSPGFYTRARARFEQSVGRRDSRWSFRLLSWETAGVAAAAALATALFVPWLMDEGVREELGAVRQAEVLDAVTPEKLAMPADDRDPSAIGVEQAREPARLGESVGGLLEAQTEEVPAASGPVEPERVQRRVVSKEKVERAPKKDAGKGGRDEAGATGDWSPEPEASADLETENDRRPPPPPAPPARRAMPPRAKGESHAVEESKKRAAAAGSAPEFENESREDSLYLAEPENEAIQPTASSAAGETRGEQSAVARAEADAAAAFRDARGAKPPLISVELPPGLIAAGELRTVEDTDDWRELLDGPYGRVISMLGSPSRDRRLVLLGARQNLVCEALRIGLVGEKYLLDASAARTGSRAASGCAFTLPRDDRPVVVVPAGSDPR